MDILIKIIEGQQSDHFLIPFSFLSLQQILSSTSSIFCSPCTQNKSCFRPSAHELLGHEFLQPLIREQDRMETQVSFFALSSSILVGRHIVI